MNRREFSKGLAALPTGLAWAGSALAQAGAPVEGKHYVRLAQPLSVPAGKIEVIEFFWYGCPHCNAFEPTLEAWLKKLPPDVAFRRVPIAFREEPYVAHQKIYYALEAMDKIDAMHRRVFHAIHVERQRLDKPADIAAFVSKHGIDGAKFIELFDSFSVQSKLRQARQLADGYKIDSVPAMGIHGRYYTSGSLAGSSERALAVTDHLIERSRKSA